MPDARASSQVYLDSAIRLLSVSEVVDVVSKLAFMAVGVGAFWRPLAGSISGSVTF